MNDIERQRELEVTSVTRGVERYMSALRKDRTRGREFDGTVGQRVVAEMMALMVPAVKGLQRTARKKLVEAQTSGRRLSGWEMAVEASDPYKLAYITIRSTLTQSQKNKTPLHQLASRIGGVANLELRWEELRAAEKERAKEDPPNRLAFMRRQVKQINPRSVRKWLRQIDDLSTTMWDNETRNKVGFNLLALLVDTCSEYVEKVYQNHTLRGQVRTMIIIDLRPEVRARVEKNHARLAENSPWFVPMVCPPRPWQWDGEKYTGGYYTHDLNLVKEGRWRHTADLLDTDTVPEVVLEALRVIDATAWRVNERVLDVANEAVAKRREAVLPVQLLHELPPEVPAEEWAKMSRSERGRIKSARRAVHDSNNRLESKRTAMYRTVQVAEDFRGEGAIYFPHTLDFRGRAYPACQDLHPQGDDFARGLLMFARGVALSDAGVLWLCYHAANTYGKDKSTRDEQLAWVMAHLDDIHRVATCPLADGYEFWSAAEEPWQFLAVAMELEQAFKHPEGPAAFISRLPVFVDGSCNGLQHLSAMGLDPVGAHATNLTPDPERQDIYQIVADKVNRKIDVALSYMHYSADAARDAQEAINWSGNVTRKTVKRGVMTVPYGLTDIGMRDQLIQDHWTDDLNGDPQKNATYLRDLMKGAISDTVVKATEIMSWMQDNAHILASNNVAAEWTTPSGFRVRQAYYGQTAKRVVSLIGMTWIVSEDPKSSLNVRKQVLSIVPNVIHSFDAAHMMLTLSAAAGKGLRDVAVVHDSFGCHAVHMDDFLSDVRGEFVKIYKQDWFTSLQAEFQAAAGPDVPLISPPERGDFDIEEVADAQFFFA